MGETNYAVLALQAATHGEMTFCKFLSANDTGLTGGHQAGIFIPKNSVPIMFDKLGSKGDNKDRYAEITWQDGTVTTSRFVYYGKGTRNEYRITRFGKGFPFLQPSYTGALFVFVRNDSDNYQGFVLNTEDEINFFLDSTGISPTETNRLMSLQGESEEEQERKAIEAFISSLNVEFPSSEEMSSAARSIQDAIYNHQEYVKTNPDVKIIKWTDIEFKLFRAIEKNRYSAKVMNGFASFDDFVRTANALLNRRKSRAGKSLEHHLSAIFDGNNLKYEAQAVTEGRKRPDFLFPSADAYRDAGYPTDRLATLAAKTTCKDRWRQVLNEADRLKGRKKFLCTLQQGISPAQMEEMDREQVVLVVPEPYINDYPAEKREKIWTLRCFIAYIKEIEHLE